MKKITTVGLVLLLALPLTVFAASQIIDYSFEKAVKTVQEHDLSTELKASSQPKLSAETNMYQGEFSEELEVIQDKQNEIQDKKADFQSELTAYHMVYGYWSAKENYVLQQKNLELAKKEHALLEKKYEKGVVSQMDVLNGEISINHAKAQMEDAKQALASAQQQLNQRLGNKELDQEISIDVKLDRSAFKPLKSKETKAENILSAALPKHLELFDVMVEQYDEMIDNIDGLSVLGEDTYVESISQLEDALSTIRNQISNIEDMLASLPPEDSAGRAELAGQLQQLNSSYEQNQKQLDKLNDDYAEAQAELKIAKEELEEYYQYLKNQALIQKEQMEQHIELAAHQYETRFAALEEKISLYEENVEKYKDLYAKNEKILENGLITEVELEKVRMGQINSELQLTSAKKDYQLLIKELELFKKGYLG